MSNPTIFLEQPPRRRPRKGGIFEVAEVIDVQQRLMAADHVTWLNEPSTFPVNAPGLCWGLQVAGVNAKQNILVTGAPTGGTYTLTHDGQTTTPLAGNANAATVQAALEALSNIGAGNVVGTADAGPSVTIEFVNDLGSQPINLMTATNSLTGGTSPQVLISSTTNGRVPTKSNQGIDIGASSQVFALYAGVECFANPDADYDARAQRTLDWGEHLGVELQLNNFLASLSGGATTAATYRIAVSAAQELADSYYPGLPVISLSRDAATLAAADRLMDDENPGGALLTELGTPVLASSSIGDFYISGDITVYRSPVVVSRSVHPVLNREMAIAERTYAIAIDSGFAARYHVTETS